MAQNFRVEVFDDLDGSHATQTVEFILDGIPYEIDLSDENAKMLRLTLARFIRASRRTGGRRIQRPVRNAAPQSPATTPAQIGTKPDESPFRPPSESFDQ
jgi:hypothetical protein